MTSRLKRITTLSVQASAQRAASRKIASSSERASRPTGKPSGSGKVQVMGMAATLPQGPALTAAVVIQHGKVLP